MSDRRTEPTRTSVSYTLPTKLLNRLDAYRDAQFPEVSKTAVVVAALTEFLDRRDGS